MNTFDVVVIGAGASGLMCASEAGQRGRKVLVIDHANKPGKKILMSGGGRCNFTNYTIEADNYLSNNRHFCKSALKRFTQWDFLARVQHYRIAYHERLHGQLFCNESANDILQMLLSECRRGQVSIRLQTAISAIRSVAGGGFELTAGDERIVCQSLVVATGGLSIPKMGASPFGYRIAQQFGINVVPTSAGLVPLTWHADDKERYASLAGIAVPAVVYHGTTSFKENVLFTHRGLSGPAILQISSYWRPGDELTIDWLPDYTMQNVLNAWREQKSNAKIKSLLGERLPARLVQALLSEDDSERVVRQCTDKQLQAIAERLHAWTVKPNGTEGYRTAEVTLGGVDCDALSSQTMVCRTVPGLYFIGEVVDVTGWLGGYNFQWAWSSGWCAGQYV